MQAIRLRTDTDIYKAIQKYRNSKIRIIDYVTKINNVESDPKYLVTENYKRFIRKHGEVHKITRKSSGAITHIEFRYDTNSIKLWIETQGEDNVLELTNFVSRIEGDDLVEELFFGIIKKDVGEVPTDKSVFKNFVTKKYLNGEKVSEKRFKKGVIQKSDDDVFGK